MVLRPEDFQDPATKPFRSSAFGSQSYSHRKNVPNYSFGSSSVEARANEYLGKEFCPKQVHLMVSPGPAVYSRSATAPALATPGQVIDVKWGSTTTGRLYPPLPSQSFRAPPGPGFYRLPTTMGAKQVSATMKSVPSYSWVRASSRDGHSKMYLSLGHERELLGTFSPGPHVVGRESFNSMGRQASSLRRSERRFAPPKAERFLKLQSVKDRGSWPGPAHYDA